MDISSLYTFPPTANTGQAYNQYQPQKNWVRPLQSGESATDFWTYQYAVDNGTTVTLQTNGMTKGAAAVLNMPPGQIVNGVAQPGTTQAIANPAGAPVPIPLNPVPAGEELESAGGMAVFGELAQVDPIVAAGSPAATTDPTMARILAGIQSLQKAAGITPLA